MKVHLRANKQTNGQAARSVCASRSLGNGKTSVNSRMSYRNMSSSIVSYSEFKHVPEADRCAHCMDGGLSIKNRQRSASGKPPVAHLFDD